MAAFSTLALLGLGLAGGAAASKMLAPGPQPNLTPLMPLAPPKPPGMSQNTGAASAAAGAKQRKKAAAGSLLSGGGRGTGPDYSAAPQPTSLLGA